MSGNPPPTGTFSTSQAAVKPKSHGCGCIHRQVLILLLSMTYLAIAILAGVAVWGGIDDNQSEYQGQVRIDLNNYTVTKVDSTKIGLSVGWLKYNNGKGARKDLSNLSVGSAVLGFLMAFFLLISFILSVWRLLGACCIKKGHKSGGTCTYILIGIFTLGMQFAFLGVSSRDMDDYAHRSLGVSQNNDIAMAPGYAWACGTAAGFLWMFAAALNAGIPTAPAQEYHKF